MGQYESIASATSGVLKKCDGLGYYGLLLEKYKIKTENRDDDGWDPDMI